MSRRRRGFIAVVLLPLLAGCPALSQSEVRVSVHGLDVERIEPDGRVVLTDGLVIAGDAKLSEALRGGGAGIREVIVLERMPPVYAITFAAGETRRYPSRRTTP